MISLYYTIVFIDYKSMVSKSNNKIKTSLDCTGPGSAQTGTGTYFIQDLLHNIYYTSQIVLNEWSNFALYTIKIQL